MEVTLYMPYYDYNDGAFDVNNNYYDENEYIEAVSKEYNKNKDKEVKFLQIWVFPNKKNVTPRYDQISLKDIAKKNEFYQIVSPNEGEQGVWVHQDAWFHLGKFDKGASDKYTIKKEGNGVYAFILEGEVEIDGEKLSRRDGMGVWDTNAINVKASENARVLLMEVPMGM